MELAVRFQLREDFSLLRDTRSVTVAGSCFSSPVLVRARIPEELL
jgi:hypothetical protein